jgi:hypothetical protein
MCDTILVFLVIAISCILQFPLVCAFILFKNEPISYLKQRTSNIQKSLLEHEAEIGSFYYTLILIELALLIAYKYV